MMSVRQADWLTWGGLTPDFTLNKTQELYKQYHSKTFVDIGIACFKLDEVYPSHIGTVQTTYAVLVWIIVRRKSRRLGPWQQIVQEVVLP